MYLVSWSEENHILEASLGGRVTSEEMAVFVSELQEVIEDINEQPFLLVLDYSRSKPFDNTSNGLLADLKDFSIANGADKIVSVLRTTDESPEAVSANFQRVMEGAEEFVTDPSVINWSMPAAQATRWQAAA